MVTKNIPLTKYFLIILNFKDFDYSVNKLFDNKNEIFGLGKIKSEKNKLNIRSKFIYI